jgi:hypothetical protein
VKEHCQVKISNRFAVLEILDDDDNDVDISKAWESVRENVKASPMESLGYYELKQSKPWYDEDCSKLLDQRKQAKLQWLQIPSQTNGDNLNNARHETSRSFRRRTEGISEIK